MVMAASTLQHMSEEYLTDSICNVIQKALSGNLRYFHPGEFPCSHSEKPCGHQLFGVIGIPFISGKLLTNKRVVWLVLIECADDVITIAPCRPTFVCFSIASAAIQGLRTAIHSHDAPHTKAS